ncbi:uncharacterized protein LOC127130736 [Lathyrus oleraceus]|uniref:uncharacterized protein LOC127130736 n=1 Tax=Pisum sativum TaxID=3888 RepID=UPI0021CF62B6|nr:uncharacterized protein LOC127130736 [Pisum sativum]
MSQQSSPTLMHVPAETSGSSSPTSRANEPFQMINLADLVLNVAPLSMVHPPPQKKVIPYVSKNVKNSSKSSEPIIPHKYNNVVEEESRYKGYEIRNSSMHDDDTENPTEAERNENDKELRKFVAFILKEVNSDVLPDVQTSLVKDLSPDNGSSEKSEESVPEHAARERRSKKKRVLQKTVAFEDSSSKEVKRKVGGLKGIPSRISTRKYHVGPTRSWSKVVTPNRKRKVVSFSEFEFDVEKDVQDITPIKRSSNKKPRDAIPKAPLDNASLHYMKNAERWKYVIQRRYPWKGNLGRMPLSVIRSWN